MTPFTLVIELPEYMEKLNSSLKYMRTITFNFFYESKILKLSNGMGKCHASISTGRHLPNQ